MTCKACMSLSHLVSAVVAHADSPYLTRAIRLRQYIHQCIDAKKGIGPVNLIQVYMAHPQTFKALVQCIE